MPSDKDENFEKGQKKDLSPNEFLERLADLTEDTQDSIYAINRSGKFTYVNKSGLKHLNLEDKAKVIGTDFREIIAPEDLDIVVDNFLKRLKGEVILPYEITILTMDGKKRTIEITGTPIYEDGKIVGEWGIARDLTERRRSESEFRKHSKLLEQEVQARIKQAKVYERNIDIFMRNSNDAIIITDPDKNITSWNRGAEIIYQYKAEEVIGKPISITVPPELKIELDEVLNEVERKGHIRNYETERIRKDGIRITIQSTINVIRNEEGLNLGFAGIIRDVTENKKMQQELMRSKLELEQAYDKLKQHNIVLEDSVRMLENTLMVTPVKELGALDDNDSPIQLDPRRCYLVKDNNPVVALSIFKKLVLRHGLLGLLVTRTFPSRIRTDYNLKKTPIVWLTTNRLPEETCVSPSGIAELSRLIVGFLDQTQNGVVLIEGLEYLISQNNFRSILNLIQLINDKIMISDSRLIITIDPKTLDEKEVHLIQKEASDFVDMGPESETTKRYTHLLDRFKYESERGERG